MKKLLKITLKLWDYWIENNKLYVIYEIEESNNLYLIEREVNDNK